MGLRHMNCPDGRASIEVFGRWRQELVNSLCVCETREVCIKLERIYVRSERRFVLY